MLRRIAKPCNRGEMVGGRVSLMTVESVARISGVQRSIRRSRVTLATIDAAAMAAHWRSPLITPRCAIGSEGIRKASTNTASGSGARASTARCMAFNVA